jgi:PAS domain S-box-containing protein
MQDFSQLIKTLKEDTQGLEEERARADAIFLGIGDGALVTDEHGNISRVNTVLANMLGFKVEEMLGKWYPKTVVAVNEDGKPLHTLDRPISKALITGKPASARYFLRHKSGKVLPTAVTSSPILMDGKPIGTIQIFKDIALEYEVDKMKSEFISIASHQLRTPLTSISTNAHMLAEGYVGDLTEEQRAFMDNIVFSAERMQELISTLLNITRIEAGKIAVSPIPTKVQLLAEEINQELKPKIDEKKISFEKALTPYEPVITDPLLLREVMANLLSNAVKYTPANGRIEVSLRDDGDNIVYAVKDNGYGIPEDQHDRIFTKFFRAQNIISKESVGTGLGLYMVKGIAENLGAKLWFESKENIGTTFYFALPKKGTRQKSGSSTLESTVNL